MKKNVMMRVAAMLLVCVLASTCGISGTFAKYVTSDFSNDTARVAHWGVKITPNGTAFEKQYETKDAADKTYVGENSVVSSDEWKLLAPGTTDGVTEVVMSGIPEVAYEVKYEATISLANWEAFGAEYCPVIFTIEGETYGMNFTAATHKYTTVAALEAAINEAINACTAKYPALTNLSSVNVPEISWEWPFVTAEEYNDDDTYLGNVAAGTLAGSAATIALQIVITVTQVD